MSDPAAERVARCPGCGGKNPATSNECDWCGRPFVTRGGRLRITFWQVVTSLLLLGLIGAVAALAYLTAGPPRPPGAGRPPATNPPAAPGVPPPAVTPRVSAANLATATP